ncbi:MAG TPA: hypothetical protein DEF39_08290 [Hungateiclostridium thermocellum]|jgi:hypothetical protein|nr:hypothetical protein [Acetivibrio thermocellus]
MIIPKKEKHEKPLHSLAVCRKVSNLLVSRVTANLFFCFIRWHPIKTIVKLQSYFMFNLIYGIITEKTKTGGRRK